MIENSKTETSVYDSLAHVSGPDGRVGTNVRPTLSGEGIAPPVSAGPAAAVVSSGFPDDGREPDDLSRSGIWRTAIHEGGHVCTSRFQDLEVAGSTLVEGPSYTGLTWGPGSKRALRGKAA